MSNSEFPEYNCALGDFLKVDVADLRWQYKNVVTQIYPLSADIGQLRLFCQAYLNVKDDAQVRFEPVAPWVLMQICDYGKIEEKGKKHWLSQRELAFGFPVAQSTETGPNRRLSDRLAMVYPFIYVDNPISMSLGRQVYGWSKAGIYIEPIPPELNPSEGRHLVRVCQKRIGQKKEGEATDDRLLQVFHQRPFLSGRSGIGSALWSVPGAIRGYLSAAVGFMDTIDELAYGRFGYKSEQSQVGAGDVRSVGKVLLEGFRYLGDLVPASAEIMLGLSGAGSRGNYRESKIITLKQFRDAEDSTRACYQAIVRSTLKIDQLLDGGLLFDPLSGDPTGGLKIRVFCAREEGQNKELDIVSQLGISCSKREKDFYELTPTVPFWSKMNLSYDQADSQDWRTKHTDWSGDGQVGSHKAQTIDYIKRGSGASEEIPGPTRSANFYYRVFGLKALRKTLQNLCDNHLYCGGEGGPEIAVTVAAPSDFNKREKLVTAEEALVLMLVVAFDDMSGHDNAKTGSTEGLSDRVVSFAVPVFFHDKGETKPRKPNALVPLFTFVGEDWNFLTEHEVYGRLAFKSILESPPDTWLGWEGGWSRGRRNLLTVKTILFPTLRKKGEASPRPIIKIFSKEKQTADVSKALSDFYLESLGIGQENYDYISLKQVRDSIQVDRAPYQAIVSVPRTLDGKREPHNSQLDIELEVYGYDDQGLDVAKTMGLVNEKHTILKPTSAGGENVYKVPAKPGIGIMGRMEEKTAKILRSRVGKEWE